MQGFILTPITAAVKCTLVLEKVNFDSQWSTKCKSKAAGHGAFLKSVSKTTTMQGFILSAITATQNCTLT